MFVADECTLLYVAVDPARQGNGLGRYLLQDLIRLATQSSVRSIFLEVRESNHVAIGLYSSLDFSCDGRRPNYYPPIDKAVSAMRETALLFSLSINTID